MGEQEIKLSASQIKTARDCERKWAFGYLDKIRTGSTPSPEFGTLLHAIAENWLRHGYTPDLRNDESGAGKVFVAGMHFLPLPSEELFVEYAFILNDGPLIWRGFVDLITPVEVSKPTRITAHKSTKSFYYSMGKEELKEDPQAVLYAKQWLDGLGGIKEEGVEVQWVYYKKGSKPEAKETIAYLSREEVNERYLKLRDEGMKLLNLKKLFKSGLEVPLAEFPHKGCQAYGGCTFFKICNGLKRGNNMSSLLAKLKKMNNPEAQNKTEEKPTLHSVTAINPPKTTPAHVIEDTKVEVKETSKDTTELPVEVPKPRRGRPKGSKNKTKKAAAAKPKKPSTQKASKGAAPKANTKASNALYLDESPTEESNGLVDFVLYIDCMPLSGAKSAMEMLERAGSAAAEENGVDHYRLIDFGGGPAALCMALTKEIANKVISLSKIQIDSSNQIVKDALPVLELLALDVVKGLR